MALSDSSPNIENYYIGKGQVYWKGTNDTVWRSLGNAPEFEFTPSVTKLDHFSSMQGVKQKDKSVVTEQTASLRIIMEEWTSKNLAMLLQGTEEDAFTLTTDADTASGSPTISNLASVVGLVQDRLYNISGTGIPTGSQFVYDTGDTGTMIDGKEASATATGVSVTITAPKVVNIFDESDVKGSVRFVGTNDIGPKITMLFPSVDFTPSKSITPISAEWGQIEISGDVTAVNGKFGELYWNTDGA